MGKTIIDFTCPKKNHSFFSNEAVTNILSSPGTGLSLIRLEKILNKYAD